MGAWWPDLEPGPPVDGVHRYSWSELDERVAALARRRLQWEPLLSFSATWGSRVDGDYRAAPDGPDDFAAFARALAARYGRGGSFWSEHPELPALPVTAYEVWNEENAKAYWDPATSGEYADLYAATRDAIHGVDSSARVVVGGLAAADRAGVVPADDFLRAMYAHRPGLRGSVDAVGLHPFAPEPRGVYARVAAFREALDEIAGPGVPIEVTEVGWTTTDTPEQTRASYIGQVAATLARSDCGIERVVPYAWLGPEQDASDREQWFGIANRDGSPKPSATAYANAVGLTRERSGTEPICSPLELHVQVRPQRRAGRLVVVARCSSRCRLRVELREPQLSESTERMVHRRARRQRVTLAYRSAGKLKLTVTATGRGGRRATRRHTLRLRRTHS
jgi:hypothetical protein